MRSPKSKIIFQSSSNSHLQHAPYVIFVGLFQQSLSTTKSQIFEIRITWFCIASTQAFSLYEDSKDLSGFAPTFGNV